MGLPYVTLEGREYALEAGFEGEKARKRFRELLAQDVARFIANLKKTEFSF